MLDIALLGSGGMMPLPDRFLTSLFLMLNGRFALIDCGEGTQVTLKMLGWGFKNIDVVMFTHFHADHIAGLPGLLLTIGNSGRTEDLTLIGPKGLEAVVSCLTVIAREIPFGLKFVEISGPAEIKVGEFIINSLPVDHRTACFAYTVSVFRPGKFIVEKAVSLGVPKNKWSAFQRGESVLHEDRLITPAMVLGGDRKGIKIAYCTDTRPTPAIPEFIRGADIFICEGIYGEDEKLPKAREYKHMLFSEAARLAKAGQANELWLTHYSPSLTRPADYLENTREIFENTHLGFDRKCTTVKFDED